MTEPEKLTEEERALLTNAMLVLGTKALRIIDVHAADRAALVAMNAVCIRERDEARKAYEHVKTCMHTAEERASKAESDLSALQETDAELLAAYNAKHAEVTRLTEALKAEKAEREAAERLEKRWLSERDAAEARLAAANALLGRVYNWHGPHGLTVTVMNDIRAHLAAQPATAPTRTESEQRVLPPFKTAWDRKRREGYQYGREALEQVRFGYEIAEAELARRGCK